MNIEVLSVESNATNWIIMALKRRTNKLKEIDDEMCEEVAKELRMKYTKKDNGDLYFEDNNELN